MENRNGTWYSADGKFWWDGQNWRPVQRKNYVWLVLAGVVGTYAILGILGIVVLIVLYQVGVIGPPHDVTNVKWNDQYVQFDYKPIKDCDNEHFHAYFFDKDGHQLDSVTDPKTYAVRVGKTYHVTEQMGASMNFRVPARTDDVVVNPTCG